MKNLVLKHNSLQIYQDLAIFKWVVVFKSYSLFFMSSQRGYLQKEVNSIRSLFRKDGFTKDNIKKVSKTLFIYHTVLPVLFQYVANLGGWDDDDKQDYLRAGLLGSINGLFIASDFIDTILRTALGMDTWRNGGNILTSMGDDILKVINNLTEEDIDEEDIFDAIEGFASASGSLVGLPIEYGTDIVESIIKEDYNTAILELLGWSKYSINSNATTTTKKKTKTKSMEDLRKGL